MMRKLILLLCLMLFFPLQSYGTETETQEELETKIDTGRMYDALEEGGKEVLDQLEISDTSDTLTFSWDKLFEIIPNMIRDKYQAPLKTLLLAAGIIIISSFLSSYSKDSSAFCELAGALAICAVFLPHMTSLIAETKTVCEGISVFLMASIPVYVTLHMAAGNIALGSTYGGISILAANFLSQLTGVLVIPSLSIFLGLSVSSAFSHINIKSITESVYKFVKWVMIFAVTTFSSVVSIQSAVAGTTDAATAKTVRLLASSAIPIVGGAFGEGVTAVQNSVRVLKSGASAFGIIATIAIFLAPVIQTLLWMCACQIAVIVGELFAAKKITDYLSVLMVVLKIILAIFLSLCIISIVTAAISLFSGA